MSPRALRLFHACATVGWAVAIWPSLTVWRDSIPYLVLLSVWANVASHFAAWQAARTEVKQDGASGVDDSTQEE